MDTLWRILIIMERRRFHRMKGPWARTERVIRYWVGLYTIVLALTVWCQWALPTVSRRAIWQTGLISWVLTMVLLLVMRASVSKRLVRPLQQRVMVDALTGVLRPEAFWRQGGALAHQLTTSRTPWVFAYLDLDDFKQINDTLGHSTGDAVLQAFGTLLQAHARANDVTGRLGGEEFGWVLGGCTIDEALAPVNRLLEACRKMDVMGFEQACSFSAGVVGWQDGQPRLVSLRIIARRADHALYQAKAQGKGRVVIG